MISGSLSGFDGLGIIADRLRRLQSLDLTPLAQRIAVIVGDDIRSRLAAGEKADGSDFAPLAPSTLKYHRGSTVPGGSLGSSVQVDVTIDGASVLVTAGWKGSQATKARFFDSGNSRGMPARPLTGLSARAEGQIRNEVRNFIRAAVGGA